MNIHSATAYLDYKWKAQNRHGVHSPFAYALVEDVIENKAKITPATTVIPWQRQPAERYDVLTRRMITYYGYKSIAHMPVNGTGQNASYDLLLMDDAAPGQWTAQLHNHLPLLTNDSMILLSGIHAGKAQSQAWEALCCDPHVRMSIDLYGIGLLFFKKEFKERQHFVLRTNG